MHHANAAPLRRGSIVGHERLVDAVEHNASQSGSRETEEDAHQRRLSGSVAADQADDVGWIDREVDLCVGQRGPECFGHLPEFDDGRRQWQAARLVQPLGDDTAVGHWNLPASVVGREWEFAPELLKDEG